MRTTPMGHQICAGKTISRLLSVFLNVLVAYTQSTPQGFLSIDCGIATGETYTDSSTGLNYTSDDQFVSTGVKYNISKNFTSSSIPRQYLTVRSFPNGLNNCYTLQPVVQGQRYLLRAGFMYGNYDNKISIDGGNPLQFDLYIKGKFIASVEISDPAKQYRFEVITSPFARYIPVCLINRYKGTPFISLLELRLVESHSDVDPSVTLGLLARLNFGSTTNSLVRYPEDQYDRIWEPYNSSDWTMLSTTSPIKYNLGDRFMAPSIILQTAVSPTSSRMLSFRWSPYNGIPITEYFFVLYFTELVEGNKTRRFYLNGDTSQLLSPPYLLSYYAFRQISYNGSSFSFVLNASENSSLPPIVNALELHTYVTQTVLMTSVEDVDAIMAIQKQYNVKRSWTGDPCAINFSWEGIKCNYPTEDYPRIIEVDLSSSGLVGDVSSSFSNLTSIETLKLSSNNLTGVIPNFLGELSSLKFLDLSNNQLTGIVPHSLQQKSQNGLLTLRIDGNPLCVNTSLCAISEKKNKKKLIEIVVPITVVVPLLLLAVLMTIVWRRKREGLTEKDSGNTTGDESSPLQIDTRQFTSMELRKITKKFRSVIGKGGFGTVYLGSLENGRRVAVKIFLHSSHEGVNGFLSEIQPMSRVHHKNLLSLIGYCKDKNCLALIYDYMSKGTLQDLLRGKDSNAMVLSWDQRLRIALEAAQGLEYLHRACVPPIIHRDMKTANILLNDRLEAKISDFGLSRTFKSATSTHVSTLVAGTLGYIDPEYHATFQLTTKTDVYSFGVVLLELVTGRSPILESPEKGHLIQWVEQKLAQGGIKNVIDVRLRNQKYNPDSVQKVLEIAMNCTTLSPSLRPTMNSVVLQLKECLPQSDEKTAIEMADEFDEISE